jgi:uncharacterized protein YegP (UPF0339 family)
MTGTTFHGGRAGAVCALLVATAFLVPSSAFPQKGEGKLTFEAYQDKAKEFRWRLKAADGKVLATPGEGYKRHADCKKAIESIRTHIDTMKVEFYQDKAKEYRWRLKASNGNIMAVSSEGYKTKAAAEKAFDLVHKGAKHAALKEV